LRLEISLPQNKPSLRTIKPTAGWAWSESRAMRQSFGTTEPSPTISGVRVLARTPPHHGLRTASVLPALTVAIRIGRFCHAGQTGDQGIGDISMQDFYSW
jgi:hypothetical protein